MNNDSYSPDMVANNLSPAFPTHPGAVLKEEMEYRGISQRQLAKDIPSMITLKFFLNP